MVPRIKLKLIFKAILRQRSAMGFARIAGKNFMPIFKVKCMWMSPSSMPLMP